MIEFSFRDRDRKRDRKKDKDRDRVKDRDKDKRTGIGSRTGTRTEMKIGRRIRAGEIMKRRKQLKNNSQSEWIESFSTRQHLVLLDFYHVYQIILDSIWHLSSISVTGIIVLLTMKN